MCDNAPPEVRHVDPRGQRQEAFVVACVDSERFGGLLPADNSGDISDGENMVKADRGLEV